MAKMNRRYKSGYRLIEWKTFIILSGFMLSNTLRAGPRDVADRMCNRINGVPPLPALLDAVSALVEQGKPKEGALACINSPDGYFYNDVLKGIFSKWQTPDDSNRVGLSDFTTTLIGFVKEDIPFNTIMSADVVFTSNLPNSPAYSLGKPTNTATPDMYRFLEASRAPVHTSIQRVAQTTAAGAASLPAEAVAGVLTTREFAASYYSAGTLRRATAAVLANFLCSDLEILHDTTRPDTRVRRDITRSPGGDSALYRNRCAGCHSGMDPMTGAFVYHDWDDMTNPAVPTLVYTPRVVRPKVNRNATEFPEGYITTDNSWVNMWSEGPSAKKLGWTSPNSGAGLKSLGEALGNTEAFSKCMAKKAVEAMCIRKAESQADLDAVDSIAQGFKTGGYNLKNTFADAAVYCSKE